MSEIDYGFESSMTAFEIGERLGITPESAQHVMDEIASTRPNKTYASDSEYFAAIRQLHGWMSDTRGT